MSTQSAHVLHVTFPAGSFPTSKDAEVATSHALTDMAKALGVLGPQVAMQDRSNARPRTLLPPIATTSAHELVFQFADWLDGANARDEEFDSVQAQVDAFFQVRDSKAIPVVGDSK